MYPYILGWEKKQGKDAKILDYFPQILSTQNLCLQSNFFKKLKRKSVVMQTDVQKVKLSRYMPSSR